MKFSKRECATILAALRLWQQGVGDDGDPELADIASDGGTLKPLDQDEIDKLCEAINFDTEEDMRYRREKVELALGDMAGGGRREEETAD